MLVFDGKTAIDNQPVVPKNMELVPHNVLAAHMFHVLTGCQAMQQYQINPPTASLVFQPTPATNAPYEMRS